MSAITLTHQKGSDAGSDGGRTTRCTSTLILDKSSSLEEINRFKEIAICFGGRWTGHLLSYKFTPSKGQKAKMIFDCNFIPNNTTHSFNFKNLTTGKSYIAASAIKYCKLQIASQ